MSLPGGFQLPPGHPMPPLLTAEEAKSRSREVVDSIFAQQSILKSITDRHEEAIRKRWLKKTQSQRRKLLLEAWPNMPELHRPDFQAFKVEPMETRQKGETEHSDAFSFPYVNQEDLVKPRSLLLFISSRAKNTPDKFALADGEATRFGRVCFALTPAFLNEHTMLLSGHNTPETYGKIVAWTEDPNALELLMAGDGVSPGEGIQILEIQERVLKFLNKCCCLIMNSTEEALTKEDLPIQPPPQPLPVAADENGWKSLRMIVEEAPYRAPQDLDFRRLHAIVAAKRIQAEDHVWTLREDPGYFFNTVKEYSENRNEHVLDADGNAHPILNTPPFWELILGSVIQDAHGDLVIWDLLYRELTELCRLKDKYAPVVTPATRLPKEYERVFVRFRHMLNQLVLDPLTTLKLGAPGSPPLRDLWTRVPGKNPTSNVIQVQSKADTGNDELLSIFDMLWDEKKRHLLGLDLLVDELVRLLRSDPEQNARISAWAAEVVSDLAIFGELQRQVKSFQPWASSFDAAASTMEEEIQMYFSQKMALFVKLNNASKSLSTANLGNPTDGRFDYPSDKKPTRQTNEQMRLAEKNLDAFWDRVDRHFSSSMGKNLKFILPRMAKDRQIYRTPVWVERPKDIADAMRDLNIKPATTGTTPSSSKPKSPTATNGDDDQPPPSSTGGDNPDTISQPPQEQFKVDKRALKVFNLIFNPPVNDTPPDLVWLDFVHAMNSIGFEPEKLYGSLWQFTPADGTPVARLNVERGIQFYEPHPNSKMAYKHARRLGRRLNRAYGWVGEMFSLAS